MRLLSPWRMLRYYLNHPLGRLDRGGTLARMFRWQVGSRLLGSDVAVPWIDRTRLLVRTGMHGATGNIYVGLMEFEDMAFVLHLLSAGDSFIDIGANVGVYSILAASRGARTLALEPVPDTYEQLLNNIQINRFDDLIEAKNIGVSSKLDELKFSTQEGATNHVLVDAESASKSLSVGVNSLDVIANGWHPLMVKIDVEGFEREVIQGATSILSQASVLAVLIELNGLGIRYGFSDREVHCSLTELGFMPVSYDPFLRQLRELSDHNLTGNTLYIRSIDTLAQRLSIAQPIHWGGTII